MSQRDLATLWEQALDALGPRIGRQNVQIWLDPAFPIRLEGGVLQLEVGNHYYGEWITDNYLDPLQVELSAAAGRPVRVEFLYREDPSTAEALRPDLFVEEETSRGIGLNPSQTFDSFVVGEYNRFAHAAASSVAESPATAYNPLFIFGGTGLGKTHLMNAVGHEILTRWRTARVVYVTAEDFMNEMINSIRYKRMEEFRDKYRKRATVLLMDDIQFLSGRDRTQEEFFHTFNALQTAGRQIVLTSDVLPRDIDKLEPRLRTRFEGGLMADIQAPDKETLLAILRQKCDQHALLLPADLADEIADVVEGNIRELEGVVNRLSALVHFHEATPTLAFAREHLPHIFTHTPTTLTVPVIIEAVARFHSLRSADITGKKRTRTLTRPRHIAMYLARKHTGLSFPELGREFGGRDHSTIQYGVHKVERELRDDADLAYKIRLISQTLGVRSS